jgi:hypothetical protein
VGTVVHRWLDRIAKDALTGWDSTRISGLAKRFADELRRRGIREVELKEVADLVATALESSIADERGRWLLGAHPEARSEYRIRVVTPEGSQTLVIDRYIRTAHGEAWVTDYKTSRHEGAGREAFLDQEARRYARQLMAYQNAMKGARAGLYFPLLRGWREFKN